MKILIINQHANNFGDEAAAIALIEQLKRRLPNCIIYINYLGKGTIRYNSSGLVHMSSRIKNIGIKNIILKMISNKINVPYIGNAALEEYTKILDEADYIFVSPSGADLGHYNGWSALINILLVQSYNKKVIFYLNSIDEANNFIFELIKRRVLKKSKVYVREKRSLMYLSKIGIESKFGVDTAFLLHNNSKSNEKKYISLIYTKYDFMFTENQKSEIEKIVTKYVIEPLMRFAKENDYKINVIPHLGTPQEIKYIKDKFCCYDDVFCVRNDVKDALAYDEAIANSYIVVSMRYHGIVIAGKNGVPFISLSYDTKMNEVSNYLNMDEYNFDIFSIQKDDMERVLKKIQNNYYLIERQLRDKVSTLSNTAIAPLDDIIER